MKRRKFITLLIGAALRPFAVSAQAFDKRTRRIAFLSGASRAALEKHIVAFLEGMRAHGYVEDRDFDVDYRLADGHIERISTLAEELVRSKPDLILAGITQAAVVANDVFKTIPIVCPLLADPVCLGLIKNDARPGGAVTGLRLLVDGLPSKQLELVLDLNPGATKIGLVVNPDNANNPIQRQELETAVAAKAIKIVTIEVRAPEDVESIFPTLAKERVDAVIVLRDTLFFTQRARLATSAIAVRLPTVYGFREHVEEGGLISYGISLPENFQHGSSLDKGAGRCATHGGSAERHLNRKSQE